MLLSISASTNAYAGYIYGGILAVPFLPALVTAGLVLGPYFGLAGLIAGERSVWSEAVRLIERHISFPFIIGFGIFYPSIILGYGAGGYVIILYAVFVTIATFIVWKSAKEKKPSAAQSTSSAQT